MSSPATAGPPTNRPDHANIAELADALHPFNGAQLGDSYGSRNAKQIFPHIDDLVGVKPEGNIYTPIRSLLQQGESYSKQADTYMDFKRPDIALQEYIKAYIITVEIVPRHKDYPQLKSERGDLHRLYMSLQKRINNQNEKFERVKEGIKDNNTRNGVKSSLRTNISASVLREGPEKSQISPAINSQVTENGHPEATQSYWSGTQSNENKNLLSSIHDPVPLPMRQKPPVQPKPEALNGKIINQSPGDNKELTPNAPNDDLITRFARLRVSNSNRVQDPRIRTHNIGILNIANPASKTLSSLLSTHGEVPQASVSRPSGPRDMPKVPTGPLKPLKPSIDVTIPPMPRLPDAVYSPARNPSVPSSIDIPQSSSHAFNAACWSSSGIISNGTIRTSSSDDHYNDFHSTVRVTSDGSTDTRPARPPVKNSTTVTAEELMEYLKRGSHELSILLVDIRERENFDSGHILSHSIICIEPIVLRKEISAEELSQSLVLSPEIEQRAFDKRDSFDLVIFYDQSSSSIPTNFADYEDEVALLHFSQAVYDYGYEKKLKHRPMLLIGGLDSWTDLMGSGALQASQTATTKPYGASAVGKDVCKTTPVSSDEGMKWEQSVKDEESEIDGFSFVRTTEEFFRRFPEPSAIQESMASPANELGSPTSPVRQSGPPFMPISAKQERIDWALPQIPTRPAPAIPRQSISDKSANSNAVDVPMAYSTVNSISGRSVPSRPCGLTNGSNFCYMNATIQALRATGPFREFFIGGGLLKLGPPPRRGTEMIDPPQLMAKNLANVLGQLSSGQKVRLEPKRFRACVVSIQGASNEYPREVFDGKYQQDASEFLMFLLNVLTDETNMMRHKKPLLSLTMEQEAVRAKLPIAKASLMEWEAFLHNTRSPISQLIYGQIVYEMNCQSCGYVSKTWQHWPVFVINIPDDVRTSDSVPLTHLLRDAFAPYRVDYWCEFSCKKKGKIAMTQGRLSRCPDVIIMQINRTMFGAEGQYVKVNTKVTFDLDYLDMTPYFIPLDGVDPALLEETCRPPFIYQCNVVIQHVGARLTSGHYWTLSRIPGQLEWLNYNDADVYPVDPKETQSKSSYILIYQRKR